MAALLRRGAILYPFKFINSTLFAVNSAKINRITCGLSKKNVHSESRLLANQGVQAKTQPAPAEDQDPQQHAVQTRLHFLDKTLYRLDMDVRRFGRIGKRDVEEIFEEIQAIGTATSTQCLLLLRCCGSLLPSELPSSRNELVNRIWNKMRDLNFPLDVSHYNAILKVYLENEYKFSTTDFLATMEKNNIEPNRVTYQRLIASFCISGDIEGASKILEHMKSKELPVNEGVFNSLITGHAKAKDMENAKGILDIMRNSKLEPSSATYTALLCGYSENGQIDALFQTLQEAEKSDIFLSDKDYLDVICSLAKNGHVKQVDEILVKLHKLAGYNQDCINVVLELVNSNCEDLGFKLVKTMPRSSFADGSPAPAGNFFIHQLVKTDKSVEKIISICKEMKEMGLHPDPLLKATEVALATKKPDAAIEFLKRLHKEGTEIRAHYFWPVFIEKRKISSEEVFKVLKTMTDLGCQASYDTFTDYVFPGLNMKEPNLVIQSIKDLGYSAGSVVNPMIQFYLMGNEPKKCAQLVRDYPIRLNPALLQRTLAVCYKATSDAESIVSVLMHMIENPELLTEQKLKNDFAGQLLIDYLFSNGSAAGVEVLAKQYQQNGIKISQNAVDTVHAKIQSDIPESLSLIFEEITSPALDGPTSDFVAPPPQQSMMNTEELEAHLIELKSKGMNFRGALRRLLLQHARQKNLKRSEEILDELEKQDFSFSSAMYSQMLDLYVYHKNLDKAMNYYQLCESDKDFHIDDHKVLNLAALLVANNRTEEALSILGGHRAKYGAVKERKESLERNVWRILSVEADKGNVEEVRKLFDQIVNKWAFTKPTSIVLGSLIKAHINKNDVNGAYDEFMSLASTYKVTPWKNELYKKFIMSEDSEKLQKLVDVTTEIHGEMNSLFDLACSFVECGKVRQARKIMETPGLRSRPQKLEAICLRFIEQKLINELENFVNITKDVFDVDRDQMFYYLLMGCSKSNDAKKALDVWTSMQEEDIQPSARTLRFLAEILEKNNMPIPFAVPEMTSTSLEDISSPDPNSFFRTRANPNVAKAEGAAPTNQLSWNVVEMLVKNSRLQEATRMLQELMQQRGRTPNIRISRLLLGRLAFAGDVDAINSVASLIKMKLPKVPFENYLANAYINSGRQEELMQIWEKECNFERPFIPTGGVLGMLMKFPELEGRLDKVCKVMADKNQNYRHRNMQWIYYFVNKKFDKAEKILKETPQLAGRLLFAKVLDHCFDTQDEELSRKLISVVTSLPDTSSRAKGVACTSLINVNIAKNQPEAALKALQETQKTYNLQLEDYNRSALLRLKESLQSVGKPVPFEVPTEAKSGPGGADSSDSSENSDDETRLRR